MPDAGDLLDDLAQLRSACQGEHWEAAVQLLRDHDARVRSALASTPLDQLQAVAAAQRVLLTDMMAWRDAAARQLEEHRHAVQALRAYREE